MISSAVVIPEQDNSQHRPASPSLKRRQSSVSSDSNKRPRLDTLNSSNSHGRNDDSRPPSSAGAMSPPLPPSNERKRNVSGVGAAEEKKRGQRLFGALLGTLSQRSSKPVHRKRDEIEQRQRDRVKKDTEEREEEQRRKREELDKVRRVEQKAWDEESMRIRHRNMRALAGFLQTKTEPRLYYKPWELRDVEEDLIKKQIREVEGDIRRELGEPEDSNDKMNKTGAVSSSPPRPSSLSVKEQDLAGQTGADEKGRPSSPEASNRKTSQQGQPPRNGAPTDDKPENNVLQEVEEEDCKDAAKSSNGQNSHDSVMQDSKTMEEDRSKDDDHTGEELVEGQEDDVIY